jgi:integrase/recombinase XerD
MNEFPCLIRSSTAGGEARYALGDPLVDSYLLFVAGRSRPNTLRAVAHDLKTFFSVVDKDPAEVVAADVFAFVADQRGDRTVSGSAMASPGCRPARSPVAMQETNQ